MKRFLLMLLVVALAAGGYWYSQRGHEETAGKAAAPPARPAVPVVVESVTPRPMAERIGTIGTVQPLASIAIKARVDTVVDGVHFTEGQEVKAGDLLFTLDDRVLAAQLAQAQANLQRDRANLEKAKVDVQRYSELVKRDAISRTQYDAAVATAAALEGTVKADQAAIDSARVSLGYTRIYAPMDGRTGAVLARPGATVRIADANPLVTLTQLRPISVAFNVPERYLTGIRDAMAGGALKVAAAPPGRKTPAEGVLNFVDSQVDTQSGTILVKGLFTNAETTLWPGQFVDVTLTLRVDEDALTLPAESVQTGQQGPYVYAVRPDNTVEVRAVKVARTQDGLAVLADGVKAGEKVVVDGQSRLYPGARIVERGGGGGKTGEGPKQAAANAGSAS